MSNDQQLKRSISSTFQLHGFTIRKPACEFLVDNLSPLSETERQDWLSQIIEYVQKQSLATSLIEKSTVEAAILESGKGDTDEDLLHVVSAFQVPRFIYDQDRKKFLTNDKPAELLAVADAKGRMFRERYAILKQRTLRNKTFQGVTEDPNQFKLRPVEFLLSTSARVDNVVLLGMLSQLREGRYSLEDPTGAVQLDLSETVYHDGLFAECCFVLVEGNYRDGVLGVVAMGLPPRESTEISRIYYGNVNTFGGPMKESPRKSEHLKIMEQKRLDSMFVFVSDCYLDQPKVLDKLMAMFRGYSMCPPTAFVLMGNFLSSHRGNAHWTELKKAFKSLGDQLSQIPNICQNSKIILVPGPTDSPAANILPRPELPVLLVEGLTNQVPGVILATNPCRILYCTQEIVVIREDLVTKLCRNSVHLPVMSNIDSHFAKTIICQAHLTPFSLNVCPVYWSFDSGLQLYPCPDLIVVGDQYAAFNTSYNNCHVINPGPFLKGNFAFKVYYPQSKSVEDSAIPDD